MRQLISIITVARNDTQGLLKTRASVAAQIFRDFEWQVVDGNSSDGTAELALSLNETREAIATSLPDGGIFDAMNRGLERSTGDYVVFLNTGDEFASAHTLTIVSEELQTRRPDLLYGDSFEYFGGRKLVYKAARDHRKLSYGMFACHQTLYYRRTLIGDLRYDTSLRIAGDYDFTARFIQRAEEIVRLGEALAIFDLTGASFVHRGRGRVENWRIQRDVLGLSPIRRLTNRCGYLLSSLLSSRTPRMYKLLRYRRRSESDVW